MAPFSLGLQSNLRKFRNLPETRGHADNQREGKAGHECGSHKLQQINYLIEGWQHSLSRREFCAQPWEADETFVATKRRGAQTGMFPGPSPRLAVEADVSS